MRRFVFSLLFRPVSAVRMKEKKKELAYPNLRSQGPINAPREKLSTRIMQIILETPEGSRASRFVSPSARAFLPPGSSLVTSSLYLATPRSSSSPYLPARLHLPFSSFPTPFARDLIVCTKVRPRDRNELIRLR